MKVIVEREDFLKSIQKVLGIVEKRTTMPILNSLLLETDERMVIKATNLENSIIIHSNVQIEEKGTICIPAKKLYEIVKNLSDAKITLKKEDKNLIIKCGKSVFKIFTQATEDFPAIKTVAHDKCISLKKDQFINSLNKVEYSIYPDDSRTGLHGVLLQKEDSKLRFVASDGYRLAYNEVTYDGSCDDVLIPKKAVTEIKKITAGSTSEDINIYIGENHASFEIDDIILITRLNDAKFPNYKEVIPHNQHKAFLNKESLIDSLERISTVAEENTKGIILSISPGKLNLKSSNAEIGEAEDEMEINYDGESISIGFNAEFLIQAIKQVEADTVELSFKDSQTAILVSGDESYKAIVMPIRIV